MTLRRAQTIFVDADDTLWENNVYYEEVVRRYCTALQDRGVEPEVAMATLLSIERARTRTNGYGVRNFRDSLHEACRRLVGEADPALSRLVDEDCAGLLRQPLQLLPGVADTLHELSGRHRLILLTKGDPDDQLDKLRRSEIRTCFHQVDVLREKDEAAYADAIRRHGVRPGSGWMVGNSPRSDVLPALAVGLRVVYIPHRVTWTLEMAEVPAEADGRLIVIERFTQLVDLL